MRCITAVTTGEARFVALEKVSTAEFATGLRQSERYIDSILNLIGGRLGLDHNRVLTSRGALPLMVRFLHQRGGRFANHAEQDQLLYWYVHTMLWGRYSASTESTLDRDLDAIEDNTTALPRLIDLLHQDRGDLTLYPRDFQDWSRSARFYPLLYMLTRVWHARDWESGLDLIAHLLGKTSGLQIHHIFPKSLLYEAGYSKKQVNQLANFTFLTQDANLRVSNQNPMDYLPYYADKHPGAIESHWIPMDPDLWRIDYYLDFLEARRELLAEAANAFLNSLEHGTVPEPVVTESLLEQEPVEVFTSIASDEEEELLLDIADWVLEMGLAEGELLYQLVDEVSGEPLAIIDLAWPGGLQEGLTQPVALLIDENNNVKDTVQQAGFRYFTDIESFRDYVEHEVLELEPAGA